jgi:hypothetical protein
MAVSLSWRWRSLCTGPDTSDDGQLALMDAMVFFCISVLVCSIMVSSTCQAVDREDPGSASARCDAAKVLSVCLRSTFDGSSLPDPDAAKLLRGTEDIAQVLMVLGLVAADGVLPPQLASIAMGVLEAVSSVCHPSLDPHISLVSIEEGLHVTVLAIEKSPVPEAEELRAASQEIRGPGEEMLLAVLVLSPTPEPHPLGV